MLTVSHISSSIMSLPGGGGGNVNEMWEVIMTEDGIS